jgi:ABC-type branched-subunit amino acid transport system ATPase component
MTNKCHVPMFRMETSKVEDFLGRTPEMHQVISYIQNKRIVNVMGIPGIGKTTLIKAIAHYLDERLLFKDGIIMLSLRNLDQASMILTRLELIINKKVKDFLSSAEPSS